MTRTRRDFDMRKLTLLLAASLCLVVAGAAQADLAAFTDNTYNWVSYNDATAGSPYGDEVDLTPGTKFITDFTYDTDYDHNYFESTRLWSQGLIIGGTGGPGVQAADLVDYDTGAVTTNLTWTLVNPQSDNNLWTSESAFAASGDRAVVFSDTLGVATGTGFGRYRQEQHNASKLAGRGASLFFSGLNDSTTYDFAAAASATSNNLGDMVYSVVVGTGATNASVASSGYTPGVTSNAGDDLIAFTGIAPVGGIIEIQYVSVGGTGARGNDLLPSAFAFGEAISEPAFAAGDVDEDGDIDGDDIDLMGDAIRLGANPTGANYDLSADGTTGGTDGSVTILDLDYLVRSLVETSAVDDGGNPIFGTEYGDFNLDGEIELGDLTRLGTYYGIGDMWAQGNANPHLDLLIELGDLTVLGTFYGASNGGVDAIPEPATLSLLAIGGVITLVRRRRK